MDVLSIPNDPLLHILSYLQYKDLVSVCQTCRRLNELCNDDQLWRLNCKQIWLQESHPPDVTWKQHFIKWFEDYGRYTDCYAEIRRAWDILEDNLERTGAEVRERQCRPNAALNPGTNEHVLEEIERILGYALPNDVRCSYRLHNGQSSSTSFGILGSAATYYVMTESGVNVQDYGTNLLQTLIPSNVREEKDQNPPGLLSLTLCPFSQLSYMVVLDEISGLEPGQIVSRANWQAYYTDDRRPQYYPDCFIMGNSFKEWFCDFAEKLRCDKFVISEGQIFRFYRDPACVATTCSVRVEVATCFMPNVSSICPPFLIYAYHITLSMSESASKLEKCKLLRRHWIITDEDGNEEHVDGPGVVGEFPVVQPGSRFSYVSCTTYRTTYGNMRGTFTMLNLASGAEFDIVCPTFHLRSPPQVTGEDRKHRRDLAKKNN